MSNLVKRMDLRRAKAALPWIPRAAQPHAGPRAVAPPRRAPFRRAARFALLALTLGLAGVLLWSTPAEAQTARILVSNVAITTDDDDVSLDGKDHAQLFQTGANTGATAGWTLTSLIAVSQDAEGDDFDVEICEADDTTEFPTSTCTELTGPSSFAAGNLEFTHPGLHLNANANYVAVFKQYETEDVTLDSTTSGGEDSTGLTGWSIKDKFDLKSSGAWQQKDGGNEAIQITVEGFETPANQDATGAPRVLRSAESAGILVADTSGIADGNGFPTVPGPLIRVDWSYQWIRIDGDTSTETDIGVDSPSYQLVDADIGNLIKVQVSFEDRQRYSETVTSLPFGPIAEAAGPSQTPSTLVGNTGQSPSATAMITGQYAMGFRLGNHGQGYEISSVSIDLAAAPSSLTVSLWIAGQPDLPHGGTRAYKLFDFENPPSFQAGLNKFTAPAGAFAYQNINHFIVLSGFGASLSITETTSDDEDAGGETGAILFDTVGGDSSVLRLAVEGSRRERGILASTYAQSFDDDQEIISLGDLWTVGITVGAADRYLIRGFSWISDNATSAYGGMGNPMGLWNESSGALGTKRFTLHKIRNNAGLNGWTAPQGATVEGSASYFFGQDARGSFTRVDSILTRTWGIDPAGNDAPTAPGVTLFDGPGDASIGPHDIPFMAVLGEPLHAMVQNLGQADNTFLTVATATSVVTQGFTTSPNAAGYELQGIGVNIEGSDSGGGVAQVPDDAASVSVAVYSADADGKPAAKLFDLVSPTEYAPASHSFFEAPAGTTLEPSTSYVVVWSRLGGTTSHRLRQTLSNGEDAGAFAGFSIADVFYRGADIDSLAMDSGGNALEIAVYGNAITPLKRVTGFDFHNSNSGARGIWGNDDTFWVANDGAGSVAADKLYAYNRSDGSRDTGSDFDNLNTAGNNDARGICSDGTTMFVADSGDNMVYAYKMSDTTRDSSKDVTLDADNGSAHGLSCDSTHLWVADATNSHTTSKIFVYETDGTHASSLDIGAGTLSPSNTDGTINNHRPSGMWSNGTTLFVADHVDGKIYAYQLADRTRDDAKNLSLDTDNADAEGLWFDGRVLWVVDTSDGQLYAYDLPGAQPDNTPAAGVPTLDATAQQDIELTADISGITDSTDGLGNVLYLYQWIRVDGGDETELDGETGPSYTPTADDVGKNLKVRVIFDDDAGNQEYPRTSPEIGPVLVAPPTVSSVEITSTAPNPAYAIGGVVETTVTFSAAVDITGTPQLELDFAGAPKAVDCAAATNQNWMGCYYEVVAGDVAAGGIAIAANKLTLNGGAITAIGSTTITAVLAHAAVAIDANHKVDGIRPTLVTTGANAPTTSTDGTKVILTFSEDIGTVTRSLITIEGNSVALPTSGESISGPTVELTLTTALTDSAASLTVALAVGAVSDAAGNDNATLAAATVTNAVVSATAPTVTGVALTSTTAPYGIGEAVQATVTFSEAVDITGSPQLELNFAGSAKAAGCATGTNKTTMVCSYTVLVNDSAPNGIAIAANKLTGGTITATGSTTAADLDHSAVAINANHKVDGVRPTLVTTGANAPTTSTDGGKVILTFSEDIGSVDRTNITIYDANAPSNMFSTSGESISGRTVELTLTTALTDSTTSLEIDVAAEAVTDAAGNSNTTLVAVTVTNNVGSTVVTPTVTGVALTSAPNNATYGYNIGGVIEATVTFSEALDITGSPQLELNFAGSAKAAGCATGTNKTTMVCSYTVLVNDSAPNGIAIAANKLTGGTITATGSTTAADLDHSAVAINANHKVDGVRPTLVTTGANAPTTSADGTKVILTFSETVTGVNRFNITIGIPGGNVAQTSAARTAGATVELDLSTVIDATVMLTVALAGSAVFDGAGNFNLAEAATPVINAIASTTAPTVTGVALTSNPGSDNTYATGDAVEATVTFSEAVDISGVPRLELDFDGTAKMAACATGTITTTMVCSYTVAVGNSAPNGIAISANKLAGGTIRATGSTTIAANRDHSAVAANANHKVDGIRPTLLASGPNAPTTSSTDGTQVILTFSEAISAADHGKITIRSGATTLTTSAASTNGTRVEVTLATALTSTSTNITVALAADAVTDAVGNANLALAATPVSNVVGVLNLDPSFPSTEDGLRSVPEDTPAGGNVGAPVSAEDPERDTLTYSLTGTDAASFVINSDGQLRVATGVELDYEGKRTYRVTVQVSDGKDESGAGDMDAIDDTQSVTITVTNANEAPVVTGPSTASIEENSSSMVASYRATDPEGDKFTWSARSAFSNDFWISSRGELYFRTPPNFEGQTTYTVTVSAIDDDATKPEPGSLPVTVTVTDEEEEGVVTISPPRGWLDDVTQFIADLSDGDGSISGTTWQWARSPNGGSNWTDIPGATSYSYMEADADANQYLRATASYTDRLGSGKTASATLQTPVGDARPAANTEPTFAEATATRTVSAGTAAGRSVGAPVRATDSDQGDVLTYSLIGAGADAFDIDAASGQIRTKAVLDSTEKDSYDVTVSVHDGFNALYVASTGSDDTIMVTITVTAVARRTPSGGGGGGGGGGAPANRAPEFTEGDRTTRSVAENTPAGANIGDPVTARDREDDTLTYILRGADAESFGIDPATGQLLTKAPLDHEATAAYSFIVSVSDGKSSSGRESDSRDDSITVTINVEDVDEPGAVALSSHQPQVDVALTATLTDPDGGLAGVVWLWERSADRADWTEIDGAVSDVYTPVVGDLGSYLRATASYDDGHGLGKSAGAVTGDPVLVNTVPRFPSLTITIEVEEGSGDAESGGAGAPVAAADPDGDMLTYSLSGDDAGFFEIDASTGQLWSNAPLDYETQANYTVVVSVRDSRDFNGDPDTAVDASVTVTIAVVNVAEPGTLTLPSFPPRVGVPFAARLTDPDGVVGEVVWQWERSRDGNPWSSSWRAIGGAESAAYAPVEGDLGYYLRVTASYEDGHGPDKTRQAITDAPVKENVGPVFPDASDGVFERSVAENTGEGEVVGGPVAATSPSGGALTYALGGADAALFAIDADTGQIRVAAGTALDYEADENVYEVIVTAADSSGASATIAVTITVTDVDLTGRANNYDADKNEVIDRDEALAAVADYFANRITRDEAVAVVQLYFAG